MTRQFEFSYDGEFSKGFEHTLAYKDSHLVLSLDHPPLIVLPLENLFSLLGKRLRHWRETILRHAVSQKQTLCPFAPGDRRSSSSPPPRSSYPRVKCRRSLMSLWPCQPFTYRAQSRRSSISPFWRIAFWYAQYVFPIAFLFVRLMQKKRETTTRWSVLFVVRFDRIARDCTFRIIKLESLDHRDVNRGFYTLAFFFSDTKFHDDARCRV